MRRIQFRAWDKGCDCLFNVNHIDNLNNDKPVEVWTNIIEGGHRFNSIELEQYTGVVDRDGTQICEGDIVSFDFYGIHHVIDWGVVKFIRGGFVIDATFEKVRLLDIDEDNSFARSKNDPGYTIEKFKVRGNIHENPDLLKETGIQETWKSGER